METIRWRFVFLTMVAPAAWGTTYIVTEQDAIFPAPAQEALAARAGSTRRAT